MTGAAGARAARPRRASTTDVKRRTREPGVATGLAWTPVGGDVLFIEATAMPGTGKLTITGQLGDVMKESAQAALSYVRGHADLPDDWFADARPAHPRAGRRDPKDGPSAGITMATALVSLVTGRPVRDDVAMTGEITLTGQVLPIGGLKEKALAAQRAGVKRVLAPRRNEPRPRGHPGALREELDFVWVDESARSSTPRSRRPRPGMLSRNPNRRERGDGEEEGGQGPEGGREGAIQPVRPADRR